MFKLAELFVEIKANDAALQTQVNKIQPQLSALGTAIGTAAGGLAIQAINAATSAITGFFAKGISGASDLAETTSKLDTVFGDSAGKIKAQADEMAKSFGLPKQAVLDAAASFGLLGKAAGQSQSQAADLSSKMAKLAADAASFYNVPLDEALGKIRSGLVGEAEPMRAFGVLLSEEAVAAEAVALGLAKSAKEVDNQAKVMARASLITKGLGDASGDLERTANSTSNQWRKFQGTMENLAVSIGTSLSPAINTLVNLAGDMASSLSAAFESSRSSFEAFSTGVVDTVTTIGIMWRNLPDIWEIVQISFRENFINMTAQVGAFLANMGILGNYVANNWVALVKDGANAVAAILSNLGENIYALGKAFGDWMANPTKGFIFEWKPLLDGFKATAEALPELAKPALVDLQNEINEVAGRIADREKSRGDALKAQADTAKKTGAATAGGVAKKEKEFKSETFDSADFAAKIRENIFNAGKSDIPGQQLQVQQRIAAASEQTAAALSKGVVARAG